ncbi:MAG: hypothetical protein IPL46_05305 [Saprospiraceae bacterium]|nr:hypothetical protein [Saprospiraceae bacterium]
MQNNKYMAEVMELKEVHQLPNAWSTSDLQDLLVLIEYEDPSSIPEIELLEMTGLALSELKPVEAADKALELRLSDLTAGQRANIAEELRGERLWESYPEISMHKELFNVAYILHLAFPRIFPKPDAAEIQLKVAAINPKSAFNLRQLNASFLTRLLADGMDEHSTIYRLFQENLISNPFPESDYIIWQCQQSGFNDGNQSNTFTIHTSWNCVDELKGINKFESKAFSDAELED